MKSLIEKLFKKEPDFSYTVAEYLPVKKRFKNSVSMTEYQFDQALEQNTQSDEMSIDNIHQRS